MKKPKISVITTSYNRKEKLKRAIESIINQTFTDWELIIVDDFSTDGSRDLIKKYAKKDKRIRHILRRKNFGTHPRPKNEGIKKARADYIAFLDDDNAYRRDHLSALYREMERYKDTIDVIYGDRMVIDETGKSPSLPGEPRSEFNLALLAQQNYIDTSDVLCKKEAILSCGGWDESLKYFADWNLWVRMAKNGSKFKHLPLIITDYYHHGENNALKNREKAKEIEKQGIPLDSERGMNMWRGFDVQGCKIWPDKTLFGKRPKLKVAVYTLTYNRLNCTIETFLSMRERTKYPFDHYVIDNGSTDKTRIWLADNEKKYKLKLYLSDKNLGISKGSNTALDMMKKKYDIIIKIDNDCKFLTDNWLEEIVDIFERSGLVVVSPYIEGLIDHPGGMPRLHDGYIDRHYVGVVEHLGGICVAARGFACQDFRWDEDDFYHGQQDWIFSQEMKKRGYKLLYLENVKVEHLFDTSKRSNNKELKTKEGRDYLKRRFDVEKVTRYDPSSATNNQRKNKKRAS